MKDSNDLGASVYCESGQFRRVDIRIGREAGWVAAALFDMLRSLEVSQRGNLYEADGRLWLFHSKTDICEYLGIGHSQYKTAVERLEGIGFLRRKRMKGNSHKVVTHWSVDHEPINRIGSTVDSDKPNRFDAINRIGSTVGGDTLSTRNNLKKHHPKPSPDGSQASLALESADTPRVPPDVQAIWSHYQEVMGKPKATLKAKYGNTRLSRLAGIKAWLKQETDEGPNTVEKAKRLIDGLSRSEHHRQQGYDCISYALRPNNEKRFLAHLTASQGHGSNDTIDTDAWLKGLGVK